MFENIKTFEVRLYSEDGTNSSVLDYLAELIETNQQMASKAFQNIQRLPHKIVENTDVKPIKTDKVKFWELKVQSGNNICRFFYIVEKPNVIILLGFTKKSQKTDKRDLEAGIKAYFDYKENQKTLKLDFPKGFLD